VQRELKLDLARPIVLFTQHSVTTEFDRAATQIEPSLEALERLAREGVQVVVTYPNNDAGGRAMIERIEALAARAVPGITLRRSLGRYLYHGVLALARLPGARVVCAGNSSSGIKETPAFGCPAINIGSRQEGRLRADNVIDVGYESEAIAAAIRRGLHDEAFRERCRRADNPYHLGNAGKKIAEVLASVALDERLLRKRMTLRGETREGWFR
jgi:UDP-N-acetylglucosamine 2-epimerase (non-hydrolysing)/GDP/UDP-N,N'-diacetylbacillosamine 2-epimerase (hydrolysing)